MDLLPKDKRYFDVLAGIGQAAGKVADSELMLWAFIASAISASLGLLTGDQQAYKSNAILICFLLPVYFLLLYVIQYFVVKRTMQLNSIKLGEKPVRMMDWLVLNIRMTILGGLSWYDLKLWLYGIGFAVAAVVVSLSLGLGNAWILLPFIGIYLVVGISFVRMIFATYYLQAGEGPESALPRKSFDLVKGQTMQVGMAYLIPTVILMLVSMMLGAALTGFGRFIISLIVMTPLAAFSATYMASLYKFFVEDAPKPKTHIAPKK